MKGRDEVRLEKKLSVSQIIFVVIITVLASFITLEIIFQNFADELKLSPSLSGGNRAPVGAQGGVGRIPSAAPGTPLNLIATDGTPQVQLSWDAPASGGAVEKYEIYRGLDSNIAVTGDLIRVIDGSRTEWVDDTLAMGRTRYYSVVAVNSYGSSGYADFNRGSTSHTQGLKWTYDDPFNLALSFISIGNFGATLFSVPELFSSIFMLSTSDVHPPTPYFDLEHEHLQRQNRVASARNADVHVEFTGNTTNGFSGPTTNSIRRISEDGVVLWEYVFPGEGSNSIQGGVDISDDGNTIASISWQYNGTTSAMYLVTLDKDGNIIYEGYPGLWGFLIGGITNYGYALSGDGSTLAVVTNLREHILETHTGNIIGSESNYNADTTGAIAINHDGTRVVSKHNVFNSTSGENNFAIRIFDYPFASSNEEFIYPKGIEDDNIVTGPSGIGISDDGTKIAYGYIYDGHYWDHTPGPLQWKGGFDLLDITSIQNPSLLVQYDYEPEAVGNGKYSQSVEIAADGSRFAVGFQGNAAQEWAHGGQVLVFDQGQNEPLHEFYVPGPVKDIALTADGTRLGVSFNHYSNQASTDGQLSVFHL